MGEYAERNLHAGAEINGKEMKQVERICHLKWGRLWSAETAEIRRPMRKVEAVLPAGDDEWVEAKRDAQKMTTSVGRSRKRMRDELAEHGGP